MAQELQVDTSAQVNLIQVPIQGIYQVVLQAEVNLSGQYIARVWEDNTKKKEIKTVTLSVENNLVTWALNCQEMGIVKTAQYYYEIRETTSQKRIIRGRLKVIA